MIRLVPPAFAATYVHKYMNAVDVLSLRQQSVFVPRVNDPVGHVRRARDHGDLVPRPNPSDTVFVRPRRRRIPFRGKVVGKEKDFHATEPPRLELFASLIRKPPRLDMAQKLSWN